ncbi:MAG: cytidylyltransferase domain-containing protein [Flavobacteriales bacterium]
MRILAIIPARGGSKRLPKKNIYPLHGKPLIQYTIEACKHSKFIQEVYVSSDDQEILDVGSRLGAQPLMRPAQLADDQTPKIVAIRQAAQDASIGELDRDDLIVIAQANSPQITAEHLDRGIQMVLDHKLWEVMSTDENGVQNAAFRIVRYHALFNEFLSAHCGFLVANIRDIHTLEDLNQL